MKKVNLVLLLFALIFALSACGDDDSSIDDSLDEPTTVQKVSGTVTTPKLKVKLNAPIKEANHRFYYNKLYDHLIMTVRSYDGELSKLDSSWLDGYEFIGLTVAKAENGEIPNKNLVSDLYDEGIPVFYSKTKDDFIFWFQEDNYWVRLVEHCTL